MWKHFLYFKLKSHVDINLQDNHAKYVEYQSSIMLSLPSKQNLRVALVRYCKRKLKNWAYFLRSKLKRQWCPNETNNFIQMTFTKKYSLITRIKLNVHLQKDLAQLKESKECSIMQIKSIQV